MNNENNNNNNNDNYNDDGNKNKKRCHGKVSDMQPSLRC